MNTKKNIFYMSLLPLILIIVLVLGAGYLLFADDIKIPSFSKEPQIKRLEGFPTIVYTDTQIEKVRAVIKTEGELSEFLNKTDPTGILTVKEPVNFDKEFVIAVTSENEKEDTHTIKIKKVYEDKDSKSLLVSIEEKFPGETCEIEISNHIAIDLVVMNKSDQQIEFERIKKVEECD